MKSQNFEFLRSTFPELADLGGFAERYAFSDPSSALVKLRTFAETMVSAIYQRHKLQRSFDWNLNDMLNDDTFSAMIPKVVRYKLHELRIRGNKAAHGTDQNLKPQIAVWLIEEAFDLAQWFFLAGYDVFIWDDATNEPPRRVHGLYSKDSLQYLHFQSREREDVLVGLTPEPKIVDRLYQVEAIRRICERFDGRKRKALLVQATGTGKTRVAVALCKLVIDAN